ncbi:MAG: hypothetical protein FWH06_04075 [Oscillospiraceae bacterium]|nr:hypothetical protein [Oscillospiraceae bacterium]
MLRIYTKRAFEFSNPKTGEKIQTAFMGFTTVPEWIRETPMFKAGLKTGSVQVIQSAAEQKTLENGAEDTELTALRARAIELKVPRAALLGKEKLRAAVTEAEAKLPDLLAGMDAAALRQYAASNGIDVAGVAEDAGADDLRAVIRGASK